MNCQNKCSKLDKFALKLQEYDLEIVHQHGKHNVVHGTL